MNSNYPRPNLYRDNILLLDGKWLASGQEVNVPYPLQSKLSGFVGEVPEEVVYEKEFSLDELPVAEGGRYILHFGAVDQIAKVYVNSILLGEHRGGYLEFSYDITEVINREGVNEVRVEVVDALDVTYPYGKQCKKPHSMWYTPVSGIWKSVFIEVVPREYISDVKITPTDSLAKITVSVAGTDKHPSNVKVNVYEGVVLGAKEVDLYKYISAGNLIYSREDASDIVVDSDVISDYLGKEYEIKKWNEYTPVLFPIEVICGDDKVCSYIAFRNVAIEYLDKKPRLCINGEVAFLHGVLDQGYFEDGIMTPKEYREYDRDIMRMKKLGFNMLRKHIKIEPDYFYYACDRLGMYVIQDMVNSGAYSYLGDTILPTFGSKYRLDNLTPNLDRKRKDFFIEHSRETIRKLHNFPSIICYTIFNEGWGQFEADRLYDILRKEDSTRLYDATSGWFHQKKSDFDSRHVYFHTEKLHFHGKPILLSECGGYSYVDKDHVREGTTYGYGACPNENALTKKIDDMYRQMVYPAIRKGLCGCIYTQLSDVENEINGLYTYDRVKRKVIKTKMLDIRKRIDREIELINILEKECEEEFFS